MINIRKVKLVAIIGALIALNIQHTYAQQENAAGKSLGKVASYETIGELAFGSGNITNWLIETDDLAQQKNINEKLQQFAIPVDNQSKEIIVSQTFSHYGALQTNRGTTQLHTLKEIGILGGKKSLFNALNPARTSHGKLVTAMLLAQPTTDQALLEKRQNAIKQIAQDANLSTNLANCFTAQEQQENQLWTVANKNYQIDPETKSYAYFSTLLGVDICKINKSPFAAALGKGMDTLSALIKTAPIPGFSALSIIGNIQLGLEAEAQRINRNLTVTEKANFIKKIASGMAEVVFIDAPKLLISADAKEKLAAVFLYTGLGLIGLLIGAEAMLIKSVVNGAKIRYQIESAIKQRMMAASIFYQNMATLLALADTNPALKNSMIRYQQLATFIREPETISADLASLTSLLRGGCGWGHNALAAYALLCKQYHHFIPALEAAGEIEALWSMAQLIQENKPEDTVRYSFAKLSDSKQPLLQLEGAWNPRIPKNVVVKNSITLGNDPARSNLVITGPNGTGKSAFGETMMTALIMGSTFGIVPADQATFTLFDAINTYANIRGDVGRGQSQFMAEKERLDQIQASMLEPGKKLNYIDEPLTGTNPGEGDRRMSEFCQKNADLANNMTIIITHFDLVPEVAAQTGRFVNYHMEIVPRDGKFINTYRFLPGKDPVWFNPELRKQYIDQMVTQN